MKLHQETQTNHLQEVTKPRVMNNRDYITVSILLILFFFCEYFYLAWEGDSSPVPILLKDFTIRKDSYIYFFSIKFEQFFCVAILYTAIKSMRSYSIWVLYAFALAIIEYPLTYNEPIVKYMLPDLIIFHPYIAVSTALLKLFAVLYFMWGCVVKVLE
jgi:hypothetical protein